MFRRFSKLGGPAYFDKKDFPVSKTLEQNYPAIRAEFDQLRERLKSFLFFRILALSRCIYRMMTSGECFSLKGIISALKETVTSFPKQ